MAPEICPHPAQEGLTCSNDHTPVPHITRSLFTTSHRGVWLARASGAASWGWAEQEVWWAGMVGPRTNELSVWLGAVETSGNLWVPWKAPSMQTLS